MAPALTVGAGLPVLVIGCLVLGRLWRWVDPWDTLARLVVPGDRSRAPGQVWPAVALVIPWLWYLGVYPRSLDPRAVGLALASYTVVMLAGCLAWGRVRWLACGEPLGSLLSWVGLIPRRQLSGWQPPAGAAALLGVVIGGLLFGAVRRTGIWSPVAVLPQADLYATGGLLVSCALGGAATHLVARSGSPEQQAVAVRALVPVAAGVAIAVSVARNRLFTSVQLLPGLIGDPAGTWLGPARSSDRRVGCGSARGGGPGGAPAGHRGTRASPDRSDGAADAGRRRAAAGHRGPRWIGRGRRGHAVPPLTPPAH